MQHHVSLFSTIQRWDVAGTIVDLERFPSPSFEHLAPLTQWMDEEQRNKLANVVNNFFNKTTSAAQIYLDLSGELVKNFPTVPTFPERIKELVAFFVELEKYCKDLQKCFIENGVVKKQAVWDAYLAAIVSKIRANDLSGCITVEAADSERSFPISTFAFSRPKEKCSTLPAKDSIELQLPNDEARLLILVPTLLQMTLVNRKHLENLAVDEGKRIESYYFLGVDYTQTHHSKIVFKDCIFEECDFNNFSLQDCTFENCAFYNCNFTSTTFQNCRFEHVQFKYKNEGYMQWNEVQFLACRFNDVRFCGIYGKRIIVKDCTEICALIMEHVHCSDSIFQGIVIEPIHGKSQDLTVIHRVAFDGGEITDSTFAKVLLIAYELNSTVVHNDAFKNCPRYPSARSATNSTAASITSTAQQEVRRTASVHNLERAIYHEGGGTEKAPSSPTVRGVSFTRRS